MNFIKIYLIIILIFGVGLIGLNLYAQVKETSWGLKDYLKGQTCPNFEVANQANFNDLTMKDQCTSLVWSRYELPTFKSVGDPAPGYNWTEANTACSSLSPAGMFRLPTAEELLTLIKKQPCASQEAECATKAEILTINGLDPAFGGGYYWAKNDFTEPSGYKDYKRSVNLLNGKVDSPVFSQEMKLSVICVVDETSGLLDKKFISATPVGGPITSGSLKTLYQKECATDSECSAVISGATCSITAPFCGDGTCNGSDSCSNCPADCGVCPDVIVNLGVNPSNGDAPLNDVDLTATVTGTATGDITYKFDCTNDGTDEVQVTNNLVSYTAIDVCDYASDGTYTAKVEVARGGLNTTATVPITVSASTLSVELGSNLVSGTGSAPLSLMLITNVSGTATGDITYKFDCTNNGTIDFQITNSINPYTANYECQYPTEGNYTAKVDITRGGLNATDTYTIVISTAQANFHGTVKDTAGTNVNAQMVFVGPTNFTLSGTTGGVYNLTEPTIINGSYTVTLTASGYVTQTQTVTINGDTIANYVLTAPQCIGLVPSTVTSTLCTGDEGGITGSSDITRSAVNYCTTAKKCEYVCNAGLVYEYINKTCVPGRNVFVTQGKWDGNLGGVVGANDKCQAEASAAGSGMSVLAWISAGSYSPATSASFVKYTIPYYSISGIKIADNWADLTNGDLDFAIKSNISGALVPDAGVWTNTTISGYIWSGSSQTDDNCKNFSSNNSSQTANYGSWSSDTSLWTEHSSGISCSNQERLYCFEQ